jgi:putative oxidoreductase
VLRIASGLLLLQHGTAKYIGIPTIPQFATIDPMSMVGLAGLFELIGGILIVIGLFTRPVAFLLAGMTAVAYFYVHAARSVYPILNGGELAALYCFVFLYLAAAGGGPWSIDAIVRKRA